MLFKKLKLIITNWAIIGHLVAEARQRLDEEEKERSKLYLNLCDRHQQRSVGTHFAEHNCDHCKLIVRFRSLGGHHER